MINLYIIDVFSLKNTHGLDTYITQLSNSFIKKSANIKLNYIWVNSNKFRVFKKEIIEDVPHFHFPSNSLITNRTPSQFEIDAVEWLAQNIKDKKNIIVHFNWVNHSSFAYLIKEKINCKTVLTKHCIPWRDLITNNFQEFLRLNNIFISNKPELSIKPMVLVKEQFCYYGMDHVICVTKIASHSLQKMLNYPAKKISVINNGIDFSDLTKKELVKNALREKYGFALDEQIVLFAGSINERKGAFDLIETFDLLTTKQSNKKLRLIYAGAGDYKTLLEKIQSNWAKITITGVLEKNELYDFYVMADIGVVPSYVEQCSYTTIEMMCSGLPIIVADVDGLKEIVPDNCGLKVKLNISNESAKIDIEDLNNKLLYFIENKKIAEEYAERAQLCAFKHFSSKKMVEQTIEVYNNVLNEENDNEKKLLKLENLPLVSVILPCFNNEKFIDDCIDSVLNQSWYNLELIIIDDGSTDNTKLIIENYNDSRIKYIKNKKNSGIVYSLNKGISIAKGKYIARIDSDDLMHKKRLEKQVQFMEKNQDIALVGTWHYVINDSKKVIGLKQYFTQDEEIKSILPFESPFSHPSVMIRLDTIKPIKYSELYNYCEDYDLWFKIASNYKVANIPEFLTYYRVHETNINKNYLKEQKRNSLELQSSILDELSIDYSVKELLIHTKISTSIPSKLFSSEEKVNNLVIWVEKILKQIQKQYNYSPSFLNKMRDYIIYDRCGISQSLVLNRKTNITYNNIDATI